MWREAARNANSALASKACLFNTDRQQAKEIGLITYELPTASFPDLSLLAHPVSYHRQSLCCSKASDKAFEEAEHMPTLVVRMAVWASLIFLLFLA